MEDEERPEFGPSGYLPDRAAKRARKIVLRAPLGLQWVVASLVAGVVVVVAGVLLLTGDRAPGEPWVALGPVEEVRTVTIDEEHDVVLVGGGRVRAFADAGELDLGYCEASRRLESPDGGVWSLTGRGLGGTPSLQEHPTAVHGGTLYLDPTRTSPAPAPSDEPAEPACVERP
jgi:hypothetical protein